MKIIFLSIIVLALTACSPPPPLSAEEDAAITCQIYFDNYLNEFKASYHKIEVQFVNDIYQLHWYPEHFKSKNVYGQWIKNHAFCQLGSGDNGKYQELKLLKVGSITLVNTY